LLTQAGFSSETRKAKNHYDRRLAEALKASDDFAREKGRLVAEYESACQVSSSVTTEQQRPKLEAEHEPHVEEKQIRRPRRQQLYKVCSI
jgi:hypothetical protein